MGLCMGSRNYDASLQLVRRRCYLAASRPWASVKPVFQYEYVILQLLILDVYICANTVNI